MDKNPSLSSGVIINVVEVYLGSIAIHRKVLSSVGVGSWESLDVVSFEDPSLSSGVIVLMPEIDSGAVLGMGQIPSGVVHSSADDDVVVAVLRDQDPSLSSRNIVNSPEVDETAVTWA